MARPVAGRPVMLEDLQTFWRFLRYAVIPILALLVGAAVWAHDTNRAVTSIQDEHSVIYRVERKVDSLSWKVDLLLEERGQRAVAPR